ncbi:MAG: hypothetical protein ABR540_15685 [Acidimicrobiales bacterium]|nr:hypothetical protein [Actinomycetota bacterium]
MEGDLGTRARDAMYTAVGFGVLAAQRLMVERRDMAKDVHARMGRTSGDDVEKVVRQVQILVDPLLDRVESQLPPVARLVVRQARRAAQDLGESLISNR